MTAQQQLVELIGRLGAAFANDAPVTDGSRWDRDAANFLCDHGPALAELIAVASSILMSIPDSDECCGKPIWGGSTDHAPECCGCPVNPRAEIIAVLQKLTEPK